MPSGKDQLTHDPALQAWWISVSHDPKFDQLLVLVRAELSETATDIALLKGANNALTLMQKFADSDEVGAEMPDTGFVHQMPEPKYQMAPEKPKV